MKKHLKGGYGFAEALRLLKRGADGAVLTEDEMERITEGIICSPPDDLEVLLEVQRRYERHRRTFIS